MKHTIRFFIFVTTLFLLGSCALQKEQDRLTYMQRQTPRFLDNVAISNSSNPVSLRKAKTIYVPKRAIKTHLADHSITLDKDVSTSDSALAIFIKDWMGVPYRYGGNTKNGIDCSAFTKRLYKNVYHVHLLRTAFAQFNASMPIYNPKNLEEGDLVFFKIKSRVISHVGVYLSDGYFVQASSHGVMISNLSERYWKRYFFAGGRVKS